MRVVDLTCRKRWSKKTRLPPPRRRESTPHAVTRPDRWRNRRAASAGHRFSMLLPLFAEVQDPRTVDLPPGVQVLAVTAAQLRVLRRDINAFFGVQLQVEQS